MRMLIQGSDVLNGNELWSLFDVDSCGCQLVFSMSSLDPSLLVLYRKPSRCERRSVLGLLDFTD